MAETMQSAGVPHLIGRSSGLMRVVRLIERMARYQAPVLIVGETGTGKELAARSIHYRSCRRDAPFVPVNCGAMPETLVETELFGCERGAFTDARQARSGLVSAAEGGTLFLDEVDALPPRAQVSLLRFLQDSMYRPIGGVREKRGDVRVIAAASPRLHRLLQAGEFRDDLVFRLMVLLLEMPPLRERHGDPEVLATYFIGRYARQYNLAQKSLDARGRAWLQTYAWPGNVRELDNLVQRALLLSDGDGLELPPEQISVPHATGAIHARGESPAPGLGTYSEARQQALSRFEREYLDRLMQVAGGNVTHAARLAGKERRAMGKLLKKNGFSRPGLDSPSGSDGAD